MGATNDRSRDRDRDSPKRRRHDSRSPSRKQRRLEAEQHQERSRHDGNRSREGSKEHIRIDRSDRQPSSRGYNDKQHQHHGNNRTTEHAHEQQGRRDKGDKIKTDSHRDGPEHHSRRQHSREDYHASRRNHFKPSHDRDPQQQQQREPQLEHRAQQQQQQQQERDGGPVGNNGPTGSRQQQQRQDPGPWHREDNGKGKQRWGRPEEWAADDAAAAVPAAPKEQPNLGLSGKLAAESNKTVDGTAQLKYQPPPEARVCKKPPWRLYVFKGQEEAAPPITLNQTPYYLFGKDRKVADIPTDHPSCSRQHAVLCFREVEVDAPDGIATMRKVKPYIIDLESINGTHLNGDKIEVARYYELLHQDVLRFGLSSREYVIMNEAAVA